MLICIEARRALLAPGHVSFAPVQCTLSWNQGGKAHFCKTLFEGIDSSKSKVSRSWVQSSSWSDSPAQVHLWKRSGPSPSWRAAQCTTMFVRMTATVQSSQQYLTRAGGPEGQIVLCSKDFSGDAPGPFLPAFSGFARRCSNLTEKGERAEKAEIQERRSFFRVQRHCCGGSLKPQKLPSLKPWYWSTISSFSDTSKELSWLFFQKDPWRTEDRGSAGAGLNLLSLPKAPKQLVCRSLVSCAYVLGNVLLSSRLWGWQIHCQEGSVLWQPDMIDSHYWCIQSTGRCAVWHAAAGLCLQLIWPFIRAGQLPFKVARLSCLALQRDTAWWWCETLCRDIAKVCDTTRKHCEDRLQTWCDKTSGEFLNSIFSAWFWTRPGTSASTAKKGKPLHGLFRKRGGTGTGMRFHFPELAIGNACGRNGENWASGGLFCDTLCVRLVGQVAS